MTSRHLRSRGFASLFAIALLGLVAAALALWAKQVGYEFHRTMRASDEAQLRQLLLAGARSTQEHAAGWGESPKIDTWKVELPTALADNSASLSIACSPGAGGDISAEVVAISNGHPAIQTLRLKRSQQHWVIGEAKWGM